MARLPRFFVSGQPLHIIQRGNNREATFAAEDDFHFYLDCLKDAANTHGLAFHAYVLMTNHVHLLASPEREISLPKTLQPVDDVTCAISITPTAEPARCGRAATRPR